jgi:hypothetical protein
MPALCFKFQCICLLHMQTVTDTLHRQKLIFFVSVGYAVHGKIFQTNAVDLGEFCILCRKTIFLLRLPILEKI